ncbi:hypothetical protein [Oceaniglobus roseus]|uniref:hypothetical protein n=1 Tax=Oceaniglobus roseus TaxID=1737570 RepID=UPI000C7F0FE7|nr:hypothetical protein [Kandeliimicrobium roseum]
MSSQHDSVLKLYEGALRALDTKSQIFLAFLAITMPPVLSRFDAGGMAQWFRIVDGICVAGATLAFVYCLMPRRGRRTTRGLFDTGLSGREVATRLQQEDYTFDAIEPIAALHDIYRLKARSVRLGIWLVAAYILSVAAGFALV